MTRERQNELFHEWIGSHDAILWKIARAYAPMGEHDDLHQDLLIAVWEAAPGFQGQAKASTFLYRVALNRALNWTRGQRRYRDRHVELEEMAAPPGNVDNGDRRVKLLYAALARLSEADRSLALLHLDGLSYREIGEVLGITENHAGVKLNRVRKRLGELLQRLEIEHKETTR